VFLYVRVELILCEWPSIPFSPVKLLPWQISSYRSINGLGRSLIFSRDPHYGTLMAVQKTSKGKSTDLL
jgi:hypothetical protein